MFISYYIIKKKLRSNQDV